MRSEEEDWNPSLKINTKGNNPQIRNRFLKARSPIPISNYFKSILFDIQGYFYHMIKIYSDSKQKCPKNINTRQTS